ncbi:Bax protein [Limimonas halophila]|uniref:Bax protein n=1 Tax=Limimonas halophila TaxID=1082479 RepID=A0A1G7TG78_9PROT|nr:glucosaminidase domain-containing protein [Limimonas halophila]SDG34201.1 Bax protein [Limimonas halophila]
MRTLGPDTGKVAAIALAGGVMLLAAPVALGIHLAVPPAMQDTTEFEMVPEPVGERSITAMPVQGVSVKTLQGIYERNAYDLAAIAADERGVPPIFVREMPRDWATLDGGETRKTLFEKIVLPLILKANAEIRADRERLLKLIAKSDEPDGRDLAAAERQWLTALAKQYKLNKPDLGKLRQRVDVVPVPMALAQAANESGWGTSRFARQGNALFGQWTWDTSQAMAPKSLQKGKGNYGVRKFPTLGASVAGYMRNLNTHSAYEPFRRLRAEQRKGNGGLNSHRLMAGLKAYSQRGDAYVREIRGMMKHNSYQKLAAAELATQPPSVMASGGL